MNTRLMNSASGTHAESPHSPLSPLYNDEWRFPDLFGGIARLEPEIRVEEIVDGDQLIVRAEAPGINPDTDVDISMANGKLRISIERRESLGANIDRTTRSEFRYGSFSRTMLLPEGIAPDDVVASYTDGVLEIRLPIPAIIASTTKVPVARG